MVLVSLTGLLVTQRSLAWAVGSEGPGSHQQLLVARLTRVGGGECCRLPELPGWLVGVEMSLGCVLTGCGEAHR